MAKYTYLPTYLIELINLDISICNSKNLSNFRKSIPKFIRSSPNSTYNCFNNAGMKHATRLRLGLSHLRDHKFNDGFLGSFNPICSCGLTSFDAIIV